MTRPRAAVPVAAVVAAAALATAVGFLINGWRAFGLTDEGMLYLLSRAWARGENLYRSFRLLYPPGQYAWYGAWMALLGDAVWVLRLGRAVLAGLTGAVVGLAVARRSGWEVGAGLAALVALTDPGMATGIATAAVFAVALRAADVDRPSPALLVGASALAGLASAWREDAAALALALALYLAWRRRGGAADALRIAGGVAAGVSPWLAIEAVRGELAPFLAHVARRFGLLLPRLLQPRPALPATPAASLLASPRALANAVAPFLVLLPPLLYLALLAWQWRRARRGATVERAPVAAALVGLAFVPQLLWERPDLAHLRAHAVVLLGAAGVALSSWPQSGRRRAAAGVAAVAVAVAALLAVQHRQAGAVPFPCGQGSRIGARLAGGTPPWGCLPASPGETLIVLPWGPGWYALESLPSGTKVLAAIDRHARSAAAIAEARDDLKRRSNRWVITDRGYVPDAPRPGETELASAIRASYVRVATWRNWQLWRRPGGP